MELGKLSINLVLTFHLQLEQKKSSVTSMIGKHIKQYQLEQELFSQLRQRIPFSTSFSNFDLQTISNTEFPS